MSDSPVMSLMLKLASIQKKIEEAKESRSGSWLKIVRLQQLRLKLVERLHHLRVAAREMANPQRHMVAIPAYAAPRHKPKYSS